jgi:hypothetical protein
LVVTRRVGAHCFDPFRLDPFQLDPFQEIT